MNGEKKMPQSRLTDYLAAFKSFRGILGSVGVLIPGFSYFTSYAPPFLDWSSLLAAACAAAIIIITYYWPLLDEAGQRLPSAVRLARNVFVASVFLLIVYMILLRLCTVVDPTGNSRFQIGFGRMDWSLTADGQAWKAEHPTQTAEEWMLSAGAFKPGGPELIWKTWTVYTSGILMVLIFVSAFALWNLCWSLLAKQKSMTPE